MPHEIGLNTVGGFDGGQAILKAMTKGIDAVVVGRSQVSSFQKFVDDLAKGPRLVKVTSNTNGEKS